MYLIRIKLPKITEKGNKHNKRVAISKLKEFNLFANNELKHTCDWQITTSFFVRLDNGEEESFDVCNNSIQCAGK